MDALPAEAETLVARIEAMLAQAEPLAAAGGSDEAAYALRETERRYLPDTVRAYLDIPPARRDTTAVTMLVEQLRLLERATEQRLGVLAESAETALAANGAFLADRFGPSDAAPQAAAVLQPPDADTAIGAGSGGNAALSDGSAVAGSDVNAASGSSAGATAAHVPAPTGESAPVPTVLVRRVLERLQSAGGPEPAALIERAAVQLAAAFPAIVTVRHGGFFGRGPVEEVALDVPRRDDLLRYSLARGPRGIEATVTRYLRGVKNKTIPVSVDEWTRALIEDLGAYVERERTARDTLTRLFRETR